jgi:hypothetical protein
LARIASAAFERRFFEIGIPYSFSRPDFRITPLSYGLILRCWATIRDTVGWLMATTLVCHRVKSSRCGQHHIVTLSFAVLRHNARCQPAGFLSLNPRTLSDAPLAWGFLFFGHLVPTLSAVHRKRLGQGCAASPPATPYRGAAFTA